MQFLKLTLLTLILGTPFLQAQPGPVSIRPDCFQFFTFTTTGNSNVFDNRSAGCPYFAITYSSSGFSGLSLVVQTAPDNAGVPGAWSTFTANTGSNPNTATTEAFSTFVGYFPWLRVQLTSITGAGSISGILYGWRTQAAVIASGGSSGCPGTVGTPCVVVGPTASGSPPTTAPVLIAGTSGANTETIHTNAFGGITPGSFPFNATADGLSPNQQVPGVTDNSTGGLEAPIYPTFPYIFNGSGFDRQFVCTNQAFLSSSSSGNQQLIALSGGTNIRVCSIHFSTGTPENVDITTGTGSNCGTGTATIDSYVSIVNFDPNYGASAALRGGAGNALCINPASAQLFKVTVIYAQF